MTLSPSHARDLSLVLAFTQDSQDASNRQNEGTGLVQPGEERALGRPNCNLPVLEWSLQAGRGLIFYTGRQ